LPPGQDWLELEDGRIMRGGHIPGALHLHASRLLDPTDWTYRSPERIYQLAQALGLAPDQPVITYCGVGISASLALFGLYLAGYRQLALYDASWEEWGTDPTHPVEHEEG
jgi:thiosulfate/3-mercaptopyruvate sulfurtransferase